MLSQALAHGDRQAINYFVAQKYVEAFGKFATSPNQKVVFLPMEASSLLSSLGGIGEIAREHPSLPAELSTAEVEQLSVGPRPPSVAS